MSYNILTSDRDDFVPFFAIAAEKAGAYLIIDDQAVGWGVARHVAAVGGDERVVWGGVEVQRRVKVV